MNKKTERFELRLSKKEKHEIKIEAKREKMSIAKYLLKGCKVLKGSHYETPTIKGDVC